jgi:hypothetical protein
MALSLPCEFMRLPAINLPKPAQLTATISQLEKLVNTWDSNIC